MDKRRHEDRDEGGLGGRETARRDGKGKKSRKTTPSEEKAGGRRGRRSLLSLLSAAAADTRRIMRVSGVLGQASPRNVCMPLSDAATSRARWRRTLSGVCRFK